MTIYATTQVKPGPLGHAALVLEGKNCGIARRLSGGSVGAHVIEEMDFCTGQQRKRLGAPIREDFSLDFGCAMGPPLFEWIAQTWKMQALRKDGAILACDKDLVPKSQRKFTGALISETTIPALRAKSKEPVWLNLKFSVETIGLEGASGGKVSGDPKHPEKILLAENFQLDIEGLDCKQINAIGSFTVRQSVHRHDAPEWSELVGGAVSFPNLHVTLPEVSVESWHKWHEDFVVKRESSEKNEKSGTLTLLSPNKQTMATIKLHGLGIFNLSHAPADEQDEEHHMLASAQLYCHQMEFEPGT
jgi:hypothetical protein